MSVDIGDNRDSRIIEGGFIPGGAGHAFTLQAPIKPSLPVIIAVPHAGRAYPGDVLAQMRDPHNACLRLEDRYVDELARQVAGQTGAALLIAHAPRAMLDLNRACDDVDWTMISGDRAGGNAHSHANRRARSGLGLVPRRLPTSGEIWRKPLPVGQLKARIEGIHRPYHSILGQEMEMIRDHWGAALLVDFHSMPPLRRRFGQAQAPQYVLGDRFGASCDHSLVANAMRYLDMNAAPNAHNRPYAGGYVLDHHSNPRRGMHAMQLEICRSTYLDHRFDYPSANMAAVARLLAGLVRELAEGVAQLGQGNQLPFAAE